MAGARRRMYRSVEDGEEEEEVTSKRVTDHSPLLKGERQNIEGITHMEIFKKERHFKRPINVINYSGCPEYNPINNLDSSRRRNS